MGPFLWGLLVGILLGANLANAINRNGGGF
jgi:hypothetical protein